MGGFVEKSRTKINNSSLPVNFNEKSFKAYYSATVLKSLFASHQIVQLEFSVASRIQ